METGFLTEDNGNKSTTRITSFISLIVAIAIGAYMMYAPPTDPSTGIYIFTCFLLGAFCPKVIQKFAEEKYPKKL